jgi:hypothetical protein
LLFSRSCSLFDLQPEARTRVEAGIAAEGSNLCGMAACISWVETDVTASRYVFSELFIIAGLA